jgi:anti-anti-sigma regulatory factor
MFRIGAHDSPDGLVLKLEGRLAGDWVVAAEACWRDARATHNDRAVVVDLSGVSTVDDAGRELLLRMHSDGAAFIVRGCAMRELVREISEDAARVDAMKLAQ